MDWLKDKKNLPIVIGMAVFVLLAAGGLIAFELGAFNGSPAPVTVASSGPAPNPSAAGGPPSPNPPAPGATPPVAKTPAPPTLINPKAGPDPFNIPGGQKTLTKRMLASNPNGLSGTKAALRDILPPFDLFTIPPPVTAVPPLPTAPPSSAAPNLKAIGIANSSDGIYAILEINGQSQPVKPGDTLQDGTKVVAIQPTGVSVRTADGATVTVPLSTGSGPTAAPTPDQTNGQAPFSSGVTAPYNPGNANGQAPGEQGGLPAYMQ